MKNTIKKGFTLIELLVVITIIGILSTIGVATFNGYIRKARDAERVGSIHSMYKMILASKVGVDTVDYRFGTDYLGSTATESAAIEAEILNIFNKQGFKIPNRKGEKNYFYAVQQTNDAAIRENFAIFACKEDIEASGNIEIEEYAIIEGTDQQKAYINAISQSSLSNLVNIYCSTNTLPYTHLTATLFINLSN